ncbi:MAG: glucose-1-phosphate adenylyltransferase subunit GlgD [Oscillospiraceae bacterium]|nr:glucose-1-phosphate adenylyltransferase subunit GlgD [Oscillospiraceae bacterium]
MKDTLGIIFAHDKIDALREITESRTAASVPFSGRYRMIDFTLSNMVNSGIKEVGVVTRSDYYSLMTHLGTGKEWDLNRKKGGLSILPPSIESHDGLSEKNSKIAVLMGIIEYIRQSDCKYVLLADANVIANIDYTELFESHIEKQAYMTALYKADVYDNSKLRTNAFIDVDANGKIKDITINQSIQLHSKMLLGTYIIERGLLEFLICQCVAHNKFDFERDVIQEMAESLDIYAYEHKGFAEKIDSVESYFKVNMKLLDSTTRKELFEKGGEILTRVHDSVPTMFGTESSVRNSMLADGCIIEGTVENSVIFRNVKIAKGAVVKNCIIMQGTEIGENANLEYCITDRLVNISEGTSLRGAESYPTVLPKGCKI